MTSKLASLPANQYNNERIDPQVWRVVAVVFLVPFMTQMNSTVVNVGLSTIRNELHASIDSVQWIISGYLLALTLTLPLNAWLVDRLGAKRVTGVLLGLHVGFASLRNGKDDQRTHLGPSDPGNGWWTPRADGPDDACPLCREASGPRNGLYGKAGYHRRGTHAR